MKNNFFKTSTKKNSIETIFQLKEYIDKIIAIIKKREEINNNKDMDSISKKYILEDLLHQETKLKNCVAHGISINNDIFKERIIKIIINFLKPYNFNDEEIRMNLSKIKLFTSDIELIYGGKLVCVGNNVGIDYKYINFDENGYFKNFKDEYITFLEYTLTHEFFHQCSQQKNFSLMDDALSEGFTDMLALMATNAYEYKSQRYDFLVKICTLLTNIIGMNDILEDYMNNIDTWPNLNRFFNELYLSNTGFINFYKQLNEILNLTLNSKNNKEIIDVINIKKQEIIIFIKEKILIPYLEKNPNKTEEVEKIFNSISIEYNINLFDHDSTNTRH